MPETIIRCNVTVQSGVRCKRDAVDGSVVCDVHGGSAPQVCRRAAERSLMSADEAVVLLLKWMRDPGVPHGVRAKLPRTSWIGPTLRQRK